MKLLEFTGKNVDEALENALAELKVTKDRIEYEVLEQGSKGFFNLIGTKPAKISVTLKRDYIEEVKNFLNTMFKNMDVIATVEVEERNENLYINVTGPKMGMIIGYRGETLDAIQYLASLVVNRDHNVPYKKVILDTCMN